MSELDRQIFAETNRLRTNPRSFIPDLQERLSYYDGDVLKMPGADANIRTHEGPAAVREAIAFCRSMQPVRGLTWSSGLANSCRDLVLDHGPKGVMGHGSNFR